MPLLPTRLQSVCMRWMTSLGGTRLVSVTAPRWLVGAPIMRARVSRLSCTCLAVCLSATLRATTSRTGGEMRCSVTGSRTQSAELECTPVTVACT